MITSTANPRIKQLAALRRRRERQSSGRFLVEGFRPIERALDAGWRIEELLVSPDLIDVAELVEAATDQGATITEVGSAVMAKLTYRTDPEGVLAVAANRTATLDSIEIKSDALFLVTEAIEKPGNVGAMLRSADAAGATAVIAADPATDFTNPNVIRAAQGANFVVPTVVATAAYACAWLDDHGVATFAASPDGGAAPWDIDLTGPSAIVIGSEHDGLSSVWHRTTPVTIPMAGVGDSLNASTSAAVILFEAIRQRR